MSGGQARPLGQWSPAGVRSRLDAATAPVSRPAPVVRAAELALLLGLAGLALVAVAPALATGHAGVLLAAVALAGILQTHRRAGLHARLAGLA